MNISGTVLIITGLALPALTVLMQTNRFSDRYEEIQRMMSDFECFIAGLPNRGLIVIAVLLAYVIKAVVPVPLSALCVIAGMVFNASGAIAVNIVGLTALITVRYLWGKHLGRGVACNMLSKQGFIRHITESDSSARGGLLIGLRVIPVVPINTVSRLYGAIDFNFGRYLLYSIVGTLPRIVSYALVGRHVFNPFSPAFLLPLVTVFIISGAAMAALGAIMQNN